MSVTHNAPEEYVEYWDRIANLGEVESVEPSLPYVGGFDFIVVPADTLPASHATPGYDSYDEERDEFSSLILVGDAVPEHVRGLIVAHLLFHKQLPDDGTPQLCEQHDKNLQSIISGLEPGLIQPFYEESRIMYQQGISYYRQVPGIPAIVLDRYGRAIRNSEQRGGLASDASDARSRLEEIGLSLPSDEVALSAVNKKTAERTIVSLQVERGERHKCKNCSHGIQRGAHRVTTHIINPRDGRDHHHYHPGCFSHVELGLYGDFHQSDPYNPHP